MRYLLSGPALLVRPVVAVAIGALLSFIIRHIVVVYGGSVPHKSTSLLEFFSGLQEHLGHLCVMRADIVEDSFPVLREEEGKIEAQTLDCTLAAYFLRKRSYYKRMHCTLSAISTSAPASRSKETESVS